MHKSKLLAASGVVLLAIIGLIAFFYFRLRQLGPGALQSIPTIESIQPQAGDPISKQILSNNQGVLYELEGSFPEGLKESETTPFLKGDFIIRDDPLERRIPMLVGSLNGKFFFGTYEDSFEGESTWSVVGHEAAVNILKPNEPVRVRFTFTFSGIQEERTKLAEYEQTFDKLLNEFRTKEFSSEIPNDFLVVIERAGVIK